MTPKTLTRHFKYLDRLRESGRCNMWGAALFLEKEQGLAPPAAKSVTTLWMKTFDGKTPLDERVAVAFPEIAA